MAQTALTAADVSDLVGVQTPRLMTPRLPGTVSGGAAAVELAAEVGLALDPWQCTALDVALEYNHETGQWTRATVLIVVARQNGKTVLIKVRVLAQLFLFDDLLGARFQPQTILHTAQDRTVARETFLDVVALAESSRALRRQIAAVRLTNGQEQLQLRNGSSYRILAPRQQSFRYWSSDLVIVDEIREHRNGDVWSAAMYTQQARPNGQMWATSNAGDPDSVVLNQVQDRGRDACRDGSRDVTIAYAEWSADPNADSDDVRAWEQANPALGRRITGAKILEDRLNDDDHSFRTEALCIRELSSAEAAVPGPRWRACAVEDLPELTPGDVRPVLAVDLDPLRSAAAIVAVAELEIAGAPRLVAATLETWRDPDGGAIEEELVATSLTAWAKAWRPRAVGFDPYTTTGVIDRLTRFNQDLLKPVTGVDWYTASGQLWQVVMTGALAYSPEDSVLSEQVTAAARAEVGDGAWRMTRRDSGQPIPAATALARAVHLYAKAHPKAAVFRPVTDAS